MSHDPCGRSASAIGRVTVIVLFALFGLPAQTPTLLRDVNTAHPRIGSAEPEGFVNLGGRTLFRAATIAHGREIFSIDSTGNVELLRDIWPGPSGSWPSYLTRLDPTTILFAATDAVHGTELWRSDGTAAGTALVLDVRPGPDSSWPERFGVLPGRILFTSRDAQGRYLWSTDGTAAGTVLLMRLSANSASTHTVFGGRWWFTETDASGYQQVWVSDATVGGTTQVTNFTQRVGITLLVGQGSGLLCVVDSSNNDVLYRLDPITSQLTTLLTAPRIDAVPTGSAGGLFFFSTSTSVGVPADLWRTDGSGPGTVLLRQQIGTVYAGADLAGAFLCFTDVPKLWRSDGTPAGTLEVAANVSTTGAMVVLQSRLMFAARDPVYGIELWQTDGTPAATGLVRDLWSGGSSDPSGLTVAPSGTRVLFAATDPQIGRELYVSDGSSAGTRLLADVDPSVATDSSLPSEMATARDRAFFSAVDGQTGRELWMTDGTEQGTTRVADLIAGPGSSAPANTTAAGDRVFFSADDGVTGRELWVSDGSSSGTYRVVDAWPGAENSLPSGITAIDDRRIVCSARIGRPEYGLMVSDGTATGTYEIDLHGAHTPTDFTVAGRTTFFAAFDAQHGIELWATDGTTASMVRDIQPGPGSSLVTVPRSFAVLGGRLYFAADDGVNGAELWTSDGTAAGTRMAADLRSGAASSQPLHLTVVAGQLFFHAFTPTDTLWVSDGVSVRQVFSYTTAALVGLTFVECQGFLLFWTADGLLWRSDGTTAGTVSIGSHMPFPSAVVRAGSRGVVFLPADGLIYSDGSANGTRFYGVATAGFRPLVLGNQLLFGGDDFVHGYELMQFPLGAAATPIGMGCHHDRSTLTLVAGDPVLGSTTRLRLGEVNSSATAAVLVLGMLAADAVPFGASGCSAQWDPTMPSVPVPMARVGTGFDSAVTIPTRASLLGQRVVVQAVAAPFPALSAGLSNGVLLTLGR